jgi:hypothetical protein
MKKLPKRIILPVDFISEDLADNISEYLSDEYGFCHKGFEVEIIVKNIEWDTTE